MGAFIYTHYGHLMLRKDAQMDLNAASQEISFKAQAGNRFNNALLFVSPATLRKT